MAKDPVLPLDGQLCFSIYSASIAIQRVYKPMLDELGVTYTQYLVLSALWERDGLTIGAVADRLALEPSTITPAVKRLEAAGFVARQRSTTDERQVQVHLSRKGASLHAKTGCLTAALLLHSGFTVPEMIELNRKVQLLRDAMRGAAAQLGPKALLLSGKCEVQSPLKRSGRRNTLPGAAATGRPKRSHAGIWLVSFMHYDLGYIDLEQRTLQTIDNPFGTRLSPMS